VNGGRLLTGVDVLDLSAIGPGARAAALLADYGARVTKVLRPERVVAGSIEPPASAYGAGRGVRQLRLDLSDADGRSVLYALADRADVLIESFRPGVAARLGIDASVLRSRNPRLIYCAISGYGASGPYAGWAGHDLNYVGLSGMLPAAPSGGEAAVPGATVADAAGGGLQAVVAVLAALVARDRNGTGAQFDVSVAEGTLWLTSLLVDHELSAEPPTAPLRMLRGGFACYGIYAARDGKRLSVAALEARFWRNLCEALGVPDLIGLHADEARQPQVRARLDAVFATRDRDEWVAMLAPADTCIAPVHDIADVASDPQFRARGVVAEGASQLAPLFAGTRGAAASVAPNASCGDTRSVLLGAGFADDEIDRLLAGGAVG
jgi:alpha-methylacyl-CoA racemase